MLAESAVRLLLKRGAAVNQTMHGKSPAASESAVSTHAVASSRTCAGGLASWCGFAGGAAALQFACIHGGLAEIVALLDFGADPDLADDDGISPLWMACVRGHADAARMLVRRGAPRPSFFAPDLIEITRSQHHVTHRVPR